MGQKRADREIPQSWRDSIAIHLAAWVETQPKSRRSDRALASALGVSHFTYNRLKNKTGPLGVHVLVILRERLGVSMDELIGLSSVSTAAPAPKPADDLTAEEVDELKRLTAKLRTPKKRDQDAPLDVRPAPRRRRVLE